MKFIQILMCILAVSCSFKAKDSKVEQIKTLSSTADSDGDLVNNQDELDVGRNPLIADIPVVNTMFLQSYKVFVTYLDENKEKTFVIDSALSRNNPNYKYRVGDILIKEMSQRLSANIARFSSHSYGDYKAHDLTLVKYPELERSYQQGLVSRYMHVISNHKITNVKIEIDSSVEMDDSSKYSEIKDLKIGYSFYHHDSEEYVTLAETKVERILVKGVIEKVKTIIDGVSPLFIYENLFDRGEFILSEIVDYQIPELKTNYKSLIRSVKEKTVPVIYSTPLHTKVHYVSLFKDNFNSLMETAFDNKYKIENNKLVSINQFANNLGSYEDLKSLTSDKKGKWFVLTNKLNKHFMNYSFTNKDIISLNYITGKELSKSINKKVISTDIKASSEDSISLGKIGVNSKISFYVSPIHTYGETVINKIDVLTPSGCSGRNCLSADFRCDMSVNTISDKEVPFNLKDSIEDYYLEIEGVEYPISEYINKEIKNRKFTDGNLLTINDLTKIYDFKDDVEVFFKIKSKTVTYKEGIELKNYSGRHWMKCPQFAGQFAFNGKVPLSTFSKGFHSWKNNFNWSKLKMGYEKEATKGYRFKINSITENYYN